MLRFPQDEIFSTLKSELERLLIMQVMTLFSDTDFSTTFSEATDTGHYHRKVPWYWKPERRKRKKYSLHCTFTFAEVY